MTVGAPTKYKPEYCEEVKKLLTEGFSMKEIAHELKIHVDTLYEWRKVYPEFSEAIKNGLCFSEGWWLKNGRENIKNNKFNSGLWFMNMKNRFGWADKVENKNDTNIKAEVSLTQSEIENARQEF